MTALHAALTLLLAGASIALASVEAAFYMLKRRRLSLEASQDPRAETLSAYLEDPPTLLMPIHVGTFISHAGMTVLLTALFFDWLQTWALMLAFLAMVLYLLLFRLTIPYALVRHDPERSLLFLIPVFHLYARALSPLVNALRRRAEGDFGDAEEPPQPAVPEVPPPPVLDPDGVRLADAVEIFWKTQVRDVMTPRPDVVAIESARTLDDLRRVMRESKYSRIPVYRENLDEIVGVVTVRDLVEHEHGGSGAEPTQSLARPVHLVPETKKIADLLKEFQSQRLTFAVVIDEYGGTAGVVSMEDIVEELVGEIKDEYDVESEPIVVEPDGGVIVAGRVSLDRLEQALEADLADNSVVGTVGGLVTAVFGRIPKAGERLDHRGFAIDVLDAERKRVNRVRFRKLPPVEAE
jgi:CBS domain containing-hemolysin-like protein